MKDNPDYQGSLYILIVEWESGEMITEPLQLTAADYPVSFAIYARENNLLHKPGWKRLKWITKQEKVFTRMVNLTRSRSFNTTPHFQYGYEIPHNYNHALQLDEKNGNNL
jgi:hypothetical protein